MHTVKVIGGGFALLGLLLVIAPRLNLSGRSPIAFAVKLFLPLWLVASLVNMAIGINRAGYSAAEEAPILLVVFGVPALTALLMRWIFVRKSA
jgi:hypothetical protein